MKKNIKYFLLSVVLLPCALILTACGGSNQLNTKAKVDVSGDYDTTVAYSELESNVINTNNDFNGFRMTMSLTMPTIMDMPATTIKMNGLIVANPSETTLNSVQMAFKMETGTESFNYFIKDSFMYMQYDKYKMKMAIDSQDEIENNLSMPIPDINEIMNEFELNSDKLNISKAISGNTTKYKINFSVNESGMAVDYEYYMVVKNGNLTGIRMEYKINGASIISLIEPFNGKIDFPNFSDYKLVTEF